VKLRAMALMGGLAVHIVVTVMSIIPNRVLAVVIGIVIEVEEPELL
jgi:hypothetical protein